MKTILSLAQESLQSRYDSREIRALSKCLLQHFCHCSSSDFYAGKDINISEEQRKSLQGALARLSQGEPLQYILGECEFYGAVFKTRPPVLIPRPETEELVDWIVKEQAGRAGFLLDVGTGSGCIAVSLALHTALQVEAWDILPQALSLSAENAAHLGACVDIHHQDLFEALALDLPKRYDVIVSNPPYVCQSQAADMQENVLSHESHLALFVPDDDALKYYEALAQLGCRALKENGCLYVEINELFGEATLDVFRKAGYRECVLRQDLSGRDRMIKACL